METYSLSEESLYKATGKSWAYWFDFLNKIGAQDLSHKEIAIMLNKQPEVSGWWAQTITVEFERQIGRREVGQSCNGDFTASVTKTLPGTMDQIFVIWNEYVIDRVHFNQVSISNSPKTSTSEKWRYWRVGLQDGSRFSIVINQKSTDKVSLAVNHEKLADVKAVEQWKEYWRTCLQGFQNYLKQIAGNK